MKFKLKFFLKKITYDSCRAQINRVIDSIQPKLNFNQPNPIFEIISGSSFESKLYTETVLKTDSPG